MVIVKNNPLISTHALAKACGVTNSPHFRRIVCDMMDDGLIAGTVDVLKNGKQRYRWVEAF